MDLSNEIWNIGNDLDNTRAELTKTMDLVNVLSLLTNNMQDVSFLTAHEIYSIYEIVYRDCYNIDEKLDTLVDKIMNLARQITKEDKNVGLQNFNWKRPNR